MVPSEQAAAHVLVTNIGVTLRQIVLGEPDPALSAAVRDGTLAAITGTSSSGTDDPLAAAAEAAAARPEVLGADETRLLITWLRRLRDAPET